MEEQGGVGPGRRSVTRGPFALSTLINTQNRGQYVGMEGHKLLRKSKESVIIKLNRQNIYIFYENLYTYI